MVVSCGREHAEYSRPPNCLIPMVSWLSCQLGAISHATPPRRPPQHHVIRDVPAPPSPPPPPPPRQVTIASCEIHLNTCAYAYTVGGRKTLLYCRCCCFFLLGVFIIFFYLFIFFYFFFFIYYFFYYFFFL